MDWSMIGLPSAPNVPSGICSFASINSPWRDHGSTSQVCYTADGLCAVPVSRHCRCIPFSCAAFVDNCFPVFSWFVISTSSVDMGKKEEEDIIRIAKKMDKMAQKKNGVRPLRRINASRYLRRADETRVNVQLSLALMDCDGVSCWQANLTSSPEHLSHLRRTTSDVKEVFFPTESYFLPLSSQN